MFIPRALRLKSSLQGGGSGIGEVTTPMSTSPDVYPALVGYLHKRHLTKTLKAFLAETSFKYAGEPLDEDLDTIYGSYMATKAASKKRKTENGASKPLEKKVRVLGGTALSLEDIEEPVKTTAKILKNEGSKVSSIGPNRVVAKPSPAVIDKTSSSDSEVSEDEAIVKPAKRQVVPGSETQKPKNAASNQASSSDKVLAKGKVQPGKHAPPDSLEQKTAVVQGSIDESSDESEDTKKKIVSKGLPKGEVGKKQVIKSSAAPVSSNGNNPSVSSTESEDESEEDNGKRIPVLPVPTKKASSSSESSSSDDESEVELNQKTVVAVAGAEVSKKVQTASSDTSSSDDSDEEEDKVASLTAKKQVVPPSVTQKLKKVSPKEKSSSDKALDKGKFQAGKAAMVKLKQKTAVIQESSDESSDGSDEDASKKIVTKAVPRKVLDKGKVQAGKATVVELQQQTAVVKESSDESSDESDEDASKKIVTKALPKKALAKGKMQAGKAASVELKQKTIVVEESSDDSSDESDKDTSKKIVTKALPKVEAVTKQVKKSSAPSVSSDDSEDESKEEAVLKPRAVLPASEEKVSSSSESSSSDDESEIKPNQKTAVNASVSGVLKKVEEASSDTSSSDDSDEEEDEKASVTAVAVDSKKKSSSDSSSSDESSEDGKKSAQVPVKKQRVVQEVKKKLQKAATATPVKQVVPSSSDDSEDSDGEQELKRKTESSLVSVRVGVPSSLPKGFGEKKVIAPSPSGAAAPKRVNTPSSSDSSIDEESDKKSNGKNSNVKITITASGVKNVSSQQALSTSSDDCEDSEDEKVLKKKTVSSLVTPKVAVPSSLPKIVAEEKKVIAPSPSVVTTQKKAKASAAVTDQAGKPDMKVKKTKLVHGVVSVDATITTDEEITGKKRKRETLQATLEGCAPETKLGETDGNDVTEKGENGDKSKKKKLAHDSKKETKFFQKINVEEVKYADPRLQDNSYWAKNGADEGWGAKAQEILGQVKGKNFRHEKTKKKRGSYKGGAIDFSSHSIKFKDSDGE